MTTAPDSTLYYAISAFILLIILYWYSMYKLYKTASKIHSELDAIKLSLENAETIYELQEIKKQFSKKQFSKKAKRNKVIAIFLSVVVGITVFILVGIFW